MPTVTITIGGTDETDDILFGRTRFVSQVNGVAGEAELWVRDDNRTKTFTPGQELLLEVDGSAVWRGFIAQPVRTYIAPALNVTEFGLSRFIQILGMDINILLTKRIVFNQSNGANIMAPLLPAHTADTTAITQLFAGWLDLTGDGLDTTTLVENVGDTTWTQEARAWEGSDTWAQAMQSIAALPGAIYYIDPDKNFVYTDVDTPNAAFGLSDQPNHTTTKGYREMRVTQDGTGMANDVLAWGLGYGPQVFTRDQDATSQSVHGRWQIGRTFFGVFEQTTIERNADSILNGSPQNKRGSKDDRVSVECVTYEPGLRAAQKVDFTSNVFGFNDVIPVRKLEITFDAPDTPKYTVTLSHDIDAPISLVDPFGIGLPHLPGLPPLKFCPPGYILNALGNCVPIPIPTPGACECGDVTCTFTDWSSMGAWEWFSGSGDGGFSSTAWGVNAGEFQFNVTPDAGAQDIVTIRLPYANAPAMFDFLNVNTSIVFSGTFQIPDSPASGASASTTFAFVVRKTGSPAKTVVLDAIINRNSLGSRVDLQATGGTTDSIVGSGIVAPDTQYPWSLTITASLVTATIAGHSLSVDMSGSPLPMNAWNALDLQLGEGSGSNNTSGGLYAAGPVDITGGVPAPWCGDLCTAVQFDDFERTVAAAWGTATPGGFTWNDEGPGTVHPSVSAGTGYVNQRDIGTAFHSNDFGVVSEWTNDITQGWAGDFNMLAEFTIVDLPNTSLTDSDPQWALALSETDPYDDSLDQAVLIKRRDDTHSNQDTIAYIPATGSTTTVALGFTLVVGGSYYVRWIKTGTTHEITCWPVGTTEPATIITATDTVITPAVFAVWQLQGHARTGPSDVNAALNIGWDSIDFDYDGRPCYPGGPQPGPGITLNSFGCKTVTSDGTNTITLGSSFLAKSALVFVKGILQLPSSFVESPTTGTITLDFTPPAGTEIRVCYWALP